jgi:hypothetical protein
MGNNGNFLDDCFPRCKFFYASGYWSLGNIKTREGNQKDYKRDAMVIVDFITKLRNIFFNN